MTMLRSELEWEIHCDATESRIDSRSHGKAAATIAYSNATYSEEASRSHKNQSVAVEC